MDRKNCSNRLMNGFPASISLMVVVQAVLFMNIGFPANAVGLNGDSPVLDAILTDVEKVFVIADPYDSFNMKDNYSARPRITRNSLDGGTYNIGYIDKKMYSALQKRRKHEAEHDGSKGSGREDREDRKAKRYLWNYGRLSASGSFFGTLSANSSLSKIVPMGLGAQLTYDQGLVFNKKKKNPAIPGIRVEVGYTYLSKKLFLDKSVEVWGLSGNAGLIWAYPYLESKNGCVVFAVLPGMSFMSISNRNADDKAWHASLSLVGIIGYEYSFHEYVSCFTHLRYNYIYDPRISFHGIGVSIGFSFRLW